MLRKITLLVLSIFAFGTQLVIAQTPAFTINQSIPYCINQCITVTESSGPPAGGNNTNWDWQFIGGPSSATIEFPSVQTPGNICFTEPGSYNLQLIVTANTAGAITTDEITIGIDVGECPNGLAAGFTGPSTICVGECATFIDTSRGEPKFYSWRFDPANAVFPGTSELANPEICFIIVSGANPIDVQLIVYDGDPNDITSKFSIVNKQIAVNEIPTVTTVEDTIIEIGEAAILTAEQTGATIFSWTPKESATDPSSLSTFVYPIETTDYAIRVEDGAGCAASDTVRVYVNFSPQIGVPTAFSPNGDGNNDILVVEGLALTTSIFKVYNRYGIQIFESTRQKNGWDGNYKGKPESPGVYYWTLEYEFNTGQAGTLSGNTTLVR